MFFSLVSDQEPLGPNIISFNHIKMIAIVQLSVQIGMLQYIIIQSHIININYES